MNIRLLILDVDGVLTDGRLTPGPEGDTVKQFSSQDGHALKLWQACGGRAAFLSGRKSLVVDRRALELGIDLVQTGIEDKLAGYAGLLRGVKMSDDDVAYVGDDLPDLEPMRRCGWPVAVANAVPAVKRVAAYVTRRCGGQGAAAEVVEHLLRRQGAWNRPHGKAVSDA